MKKTRVGKIVQLRGSGVDCQKVIPVKPDPWRFRKWSKVFEKNTERNKNLRLVLLSSPETGLAHQAPINAVKSSLFPNWTDNCFPKYDLRMSIIGNSC